MHTEGIKNIIVQQQKVSMTYEEAIQTCEKAKIEQTDSGKQSVEKIEKV